MATEWKSGDLVKLKSGGPLMTVNSQESASKNTYHCCWFDNDNKPTKEVFSGDALEEGTKEETALSVKFI